MIQELSTQTAMPGKRILTVEMIESARISGLMPAELADELGLHPSTVYQFCKNRGIPQLRGGHRDIIDRCLASRLPEYFKAAMTEYCEAKGLHPRDLIMLSVTEYMMRAGVNPHRHKPRLSIAEAKPGPKNENRNWGGRRNGPVIPIGEFPIRLCYSMHQCYICKKTISRGQRYFDAGPRRRAHVTCNPKKGGT